MSAILAPNNYTSSQICKNKPPKKPTIYSMYRNNTIQLPKAHCETCYCRLKPQPPLLNVRTAEVPQRRVKSARESSYIDNKDDDDNRSVRSEKLLKEVHSKVNYAPTTVFLKRLKAEAQKNCNCACCSGFTDQRDEYEQLLKQREENRKQIEETKAALSRLRGGDDICKNDCDCVNCENQRVLIENTKKVSTIKDFRDQNYLETHSFTDLTRQEVGDHKCVHRFNLDERMVPIPENCDQYGLSRCVICNKPMTEEDLSKKTVDTRLKPKNSKATVTEKEFKGLVSLEPKRLYVPMKDEKVEVKVPFYWDEEEEFAKIKKAMKPFPVSSLALRYQKGVV